MRYGKDGRRTENGDGFGEKLLGGWVQHEPSRVHGVFFFLFFLGGLGLGFDLNK